MMWHHFREKLIPWGHVDMAWSSRAGHLLAFFSHIFSNCIVLQHRQFSWDSCETVPSFFLVKFMLILSSNLYLPFLRTCSLTEVEMDFPLPNAPSNCPKSAGLNPLPFPPVGDAKVMGREISCHYPMRNFCSLGDCQFLACNHLAECSEDCIYR